MADDKAFTGSIPKIYETYLVPLLFQDYAADLVTRVAARAPTLETLALRSRAKLASDPAVGYCQGSPLRGEIESRGALEHGTDAATAEIHKRFGGGPLDTKIQAIVVTVER
jgi:hypothetical protein